MEDMNKEIEDEILEDLMRQDLDDERMFRKPPRGE